MRDHMNFENFNKQRSIEVSVDTNEAFEQSALSKPRHALQCDAKTLEKLGFPSPNEFEFIGKPLVAQGKDFLSHLGEITVSGNKVKFQTKYGFSLTAIDNNLQYKLPDGTSYSIDEKNVLTVKRPGQSKQVFEPLHTKSRVFRALAASIYPAGKADDIYIDDEIVYPKDAQFRLFRGRDKSGARADVTDASGNLFDIDTSKWNKNNCGVVQHLGHSEVGSLEKMFNGDKSFAIKDGTKVTRKLDGSLQVETQGLTIEIDAAGKTAKAFKHYGPKIQQEIEHDAFRFDSKKLERKLEISFEVDAKSSKILIWTGEPEAKVEIELSTGSAAIKVLPWRKFSYSDALR